jgi:hypothetical protein
VKSDVAVYGSPDTQLAVLIAARGGGTPDEFFNGMKSSGVDVPTPTAVGDNQCAVVSSEGFTVCMRSSSTLSVVVVAGGSDMSKTSSMVDEAWNQQ